MAIQLRVMCDGQVREYSFDRTQVKVGRGPANDLVVAAKGVGITHGTLCLGEQGSRLVFRAHEALTHDTLLVRDGEVQGELDRGAGGAMEVKEGDFLILGESVRLEVLRFRLHREEVEDRFEMVSIPGEFDLHPTASFAQRYLLASEQVTTNAGDVRCLLREVVALCGEGFGQAPVEVSLLILSGEEEFHDESWRLQRDPASQEEPRIRRWRDPLSGYSPDMVDRARRSLESGKVYLIDVATRKEVDSPGQRTMFLPLMRGAEALGYMGLVFAPQGERPDDAHAVIEAMTVRAISGLAALVVDAYQMQRRVESVREENRYFRERERRHYLFKDLICESASMRRVYGRLHELVQRSDEPVLVTGEAGSGKELLGRALHHLSARHEGMFISIQCGHMGDEVLGVELFGCVASELAGALAARKGVFELARGGTVYLEDVDRLSLSLQGKLVRMIKEGEVRRVGDAVGRQVDARLVVSTNRSLPALIQRGVFRHDLYMLLKDGLLEVPSLRERREDIMPLARNFLKVFSARYGKQARGFSSEVEERFLSYAWPGNVRQLQTTVESALLKGGEEEVTTILPEHLGF